MNFYEIDTQMQISATFMNIALNIPADPVTITLFLLDPLGNETSVVYPGPSTPIQRTGVGLYSYLFIPNSVGTWTYKWQGVGNVFATSRDTKFTVRASNLITS